MSFWLFAPHKHIVIPAEFVGAPAPATALFLILEMNCCGFVFNLCTAGLRVRSWLVLIHSLLDAGLWWPVRRHSDHQSIQYFR